VKAKVLLAALVVAVLSVSTAVGAPPPGKGPPATGTGCKPKVTLVLKGTLTATPGTAATSLSVNVTSANRHGRAYVSATHSVLVDDEDTKIRRRGKKTVGDLLSGDRVLVQARMCKAGLANGATPALTATRVVAHPVV
jgi:hypothetical protein